MRTNGHALLLTVKETARWLGCSQKRIYNLVRDHAIPHVRIGGRVMFRREALLEWVLDHEVPAVRGPTPAPDDDYLSPIERYFAAPVEVG